MLNNFHILTYSLRCVTSSIIEIIHQTDTHIHDEKQLFVAPDDDAFSTFSLSRREHTRWRLTSKKERKLTEIQTPRPRKRIWHIDTSVRLWRWHEPFCWSQTQSNLLPSQISSILCDFSSIFWGGRTTAADINTSLCWAYFWTNLSALVSCYSHSLRCELSHHAPFPCPPLRPPQPSRWFIMGETMLAGCSLCIIPSTLFSLRKKLSLKLAHLAKECVDKV